MAQDYLSSGTGWTAMLPKTKKRREGQHAPASRSGKPSSATPDTREEVQVGGAPVQGKGNPQSGDTLEGQWSPHFSGVLAYGRP